jgi:hypothetical protein
VTRIQALRQAQTNRRKKAARRLSLANTTVAVNGWMIPVGVFRQMADAMPIAEDDPVNPLKRPTIN